MPRGLTPEQINALRRRVVSFAYFVEILTPTPFRAWNGVGTVSAGSPLQNWVGVGDFGIIDGLETGSDLRATSVTVALAGLPGDVVTSGAVAATRGVRYQGRALNIYFGLRDVDTGAVAPQLTAIWSGLADVISFQIGETISASLTAEHLSSHMRRSNGNRMTTQSHNARINVAGLTDLFFEPQSRLMGRPKPLLK